MNYDEFKNQMTEVVSEKLGNNYNITVNEVLKTNSVKLYGLVIREKEISIAPTIYLEQFYEEYLEGKEVDTIAEEIVNIYENSKPNKEKSFNFFKDYSQVRDKLCLKLINKSKNEEMLSSVPYIDFLDLAAVPYCVMSDGLMGNISILVKSDHIKMWGIGEEELLKEAKENTQRKLGVDVTPIMDIIESVYPKKANEIEDMPTNHMYVLTNNTKTFGAINIIYEDILMDFAKAADSDFFVLPSSVHEVILLLDNDMDNWECHNETIKEVNSSWLLEEEILSDHAYYYSRERGILLMKMDD